MYAVIGAAGQVGQEFAKVVDGDRLRLLVRSDVDITDARSVERCLDRIECRTIILLAALHDVNRCEADPNAAFAVNAAGAANVARAARDRDAKLVYFSSDYVFGGDLARRTPYVESDATAPLNVYGASKVAGEEAVRSASNAHLVVRTSSLFGAVTSRKGWTFPEMIIRRARAGETLRVVDDQIMSPTYTLDLVRSVVSLLEAGAAGTVHVANSGACTWHELATATLALAGIAHPVEAVPSSTFPSVARRPSYSCLGSERMTAWPTDGPRPWKVALQAYLREKGIAC